MTPIGYRVAVEAHLKEVLTYLPPPDGGTLERGQSVKVPLGNRRVCGVVVEEEKLLPSFPLKPVFHLDVERPRLPEAFLHWTEWLADYYFYPLGRVLEMAFPPLPRLTKRGPRKSPVVEKPTLITPPPVLTVEQKSVLAGIRGHSGFSTHLLFGVTGSGKTEVYLQLIDDVLKRGAQAVVLVPEISLTPQLIDRFSSRFPDQVAVIHSHLTPREKTMQWWSMMESQKETPGSAAREKSILIGARSALFCPLPNLGLIIVDEEHEPSYKQEEQLKYHGRDAAIMLARFSNVPIILGSATPSLESWQNATTGKYHLHEMKKRVADRSLPIIETVDLRLEKDVRRDQLVDEPFWLSTRLFGKLREVMGKNEQAALFLNRRGLAPMAQCPACGHVEECPNCSVSLTVHQRNHLVCHYCAFTKPKPRKCPKCSDGELTALGIGTELVETDLKRLFPQARIARADRDEIQTRSALEGLIRGMENREIDILIGTQMIAKGLDFKHLTLVGLVLADIGFHWPDFRASERSFQLLTQVSGRAGRHSEEPGCVIVQTYNPLHPSITHTEQNSFALFATRELNMRQAALYPPFSRIALFRIQSNDVGKASQSAELLAERALALVDAKEVYNQVQVLGPAPAPMAKLRGRYRYQLLIKAQNSKILHHFCRTVLADEKWISPGTKVQVDVDPLHML